MTVELTYGGQAYTIVGRTLQSVLDEVDGILLSGTPGWIQAFDGHGASVPTALLITAGAHVALTQLPAEAS